MSGNTLAIVTAILFRVRDTNPPHGIYETREQALARTIQEAKALINACEQS